MLTKVTWKEDQVLSVQLRDDLFTLAQMREGSLMEFFDVTSTSGDWQRVDLSSVTPIFCIVVAENRLKPLFAAVVGADAAIPNGRPTQRVMLSAVIGNEGRHGANLIELTDDFSSLGGRVIKSGLSSASDRQTIYDHELAGMVGSAEKLRTRLIRYFDTGVNWDEAKGFLFKDIPIPPPSRCPSAGVDGAAGQGAQVAQVVQSGERGQLIQAGGPVGQDTLNSADLSVLSASVRLEGEPSLVAALENEIHTLIADLIALPESASEQDRAAAFQGAILRANEHADEISTEERESLLNTMYEIASIVGLRAWGPFLETWRGDW